MLFEKTGWSPEHLLNMNGGLRVAHTPGSILAGFYELDQITGGHGFGKIPALVGVAAKFLQEIKLLDGFNALGDHFFLKRMGQTNNAPDQAFAFFRGFLSVSRNSRRPSRTAAEWDRASFSKSAQVRY